MTQRPIIHVSNGEVANSTFSNIGNVTNIVNVTQPERERCKHRLSACLRSFFLITVSQNRHPRVESRIRRPAERKRALSGAPLSPQYADSSAKRGDELDLQEGRVGREAYHVDEWCAWGWQDGHCPDCMRGIGWGRRRKVMDEKFWPQRQVRHVFPRKDPVLIDSGMSTALTSSDAAWATGKRHASFLRLLRTNCVGRKRHVEMLSKRP